MSMQERPMRRGLALISLLVCAFVIGCGSDPATDEAPAANEVSSGCRLYLRGEGLRVGFRGVGADQACDDWAASHGEGSDFYSRQSDGESAGALVCAFQKDNLKSAVVDTGALFSASKAKGICAEFLAGGWDEWVEPLAEQQRQEQEAQERAADEARARDEREARLDREWDELQCAGMDVELSAATERRCDELAGTNP